MTKLVNEVFVSNIAEKRHTAVSALWTEQNYHITDNL